MVSVESYDLWTLLAGPVTSSAELRMTYEKKIQDSSTSSESAPSDANLFWAVIGAYCRGPGVQHTGQGERRQAVEEGVFGRGFNSVRLSSATSTWSEFAGDSALQKVL